MWDPTTIVSVESRIHFIINYDVEYLKLHSQQLPFCSATVGTSFGYLLSLDRNLLNCHFLGSSQLLSSLQKGSNSENSYYATDNPLKFKKRIMSWLHSPYPEFSHFSYLDFVRNCSANACMHHKKRWMI